jgi:hypothetical protein
VIGTNPTSGSAGSQCRKCDRRTRGRYVFRRCFPPPGTNVPHEEPDAEPDVWGDVAVQNRTHGSTQ